VHHGSTNSTQGLVIVPLRFGVVLCWGIKIKIYGVLRDTLSLPAEGLRPSALPRRTGEAVWMG